jgi:hypothetical protein
MAIGISSLLARVSYIYVACRTVQAEDSISDEVIHYSIFCSRSHCSSYLLLAVFLETDLGIFYMPNAHAVWMHTLRITRSLTIMYM